MYRQWEKLLSSIISFICPHDMANFGSLAAEIGLGVWGTPSNFNGFRVLASLLQQRRSPETNQTLYDVWPSHGLLCIHFCHVQNSLRPSLAFSYIGIVTLRHSSSGVSQTLRRGTRNGITELSQRAPPIFRLGVGGHHVGHRPTFCFFFSSPNLSRRRLDVYHTSTHGVALVRI